MRTRHQGQEQKGHPHKDERTNSSQVTFRLGSAGTGTEVGSGRETEAETGTDTGRAGTEAETEAFPHTGVLSSHWWDRASHQLTVSRK